MTYKKIDVAFTRCEDCPYYVSDEVAPVIFCNHVERLRIFVMEDTTRGTAMWCPLEDHHAENTQ